MKIVAAADASAEWKDQAHYVCTGYNDEIVLATALEAEYSGGTGPIKEIQLSPGTFNLAGSLTIPPNMKVWGQGREYTVLYTTGDATSIATGGNGVSLVRFKIEGSAKIFVQHSTFLAQYITMQVGKQQQGAFMIAPTNNLSDIVFEECVAIDCGRYGFIATAYAPGVEISGLKFLRCQAINCGVDERFHHWVSGFYLSDRIALYNTEVDQCYAFGNWLHGFTVGTPASVMNVSFTSCIAEENGLVRIPDDNQGAGFDIVGDTICSGCYAKRNDIGYRVTDATGLFQCVDIRSRSISYRISGCTDLRAEDCVSSYSDGYGLRLANLTNPAIINFHIISPAGDGSACNLIGISGYGVTGGVLDIYGEQGGSPAFLNVRDSIGLKISGLIVTTTAQPVIVSGSSGIDTSGLAIMGSNGSGITTIQMEAEHATLVAPMEIGDDVEASGGRFVWVPEGSGTVLYRPDESPGGMATFTFTVPTEDTYYMWCRAHAPHGAADSFYYKVDNSGYIRLSVPTGNTWQWASGSLGESGRAMFALNAGEHTLVIKGRESGAKLDKIVITNDWDYVPDGVGSTADIRVVQPISIEPEDPEIGTLMTLNATVTNVGTQAGSALVGVTVDGVLMDGAVPISLQPNEIVEVTFQMMFVTPGAKHVCVGVVQGNQLV